MSDEENYGGYIVRLNEQLVEARRELNEALAAEETAHNANVKLNERLIEVRDQLDAARKLLAVKVPFAEAFAAAWDAAGIPADSDASLAEEITRMRRELAEAQEKLRALDDHCGHVDRPCDCSNSPDPTQAYYAVVRERDELMAELDGFHASQHAVDGMREDIKIYETKIEELNENAIKIIKAKYRAECALEEIRDHRDALVAKVEQIASEIYSPRYFSGYEVESTLRIWRQAMANKLREAVSKIKRP